MGTSLTGLASRTAGLGTGWADPEYWWQRVGVPQGALPQSPQQSGTSPEIWNAPDLQ